MAILTVAEYETYTGTTLDAEGTTYVTNMIPIVQNQIETYLDRLLDKQDYSEWYTYRSDVILRQYPVNNIRYIGSTAQVATFDLDTNTYEITATELNVTDASLVTTVVTFGGAITTLTDIKTAIEVALPALTMTIVAGYENMSYKLLKVGTGVDVLGAIRRDAKTKLVEDENRTVQFDGCYGVWGWFDSYSYNGVIYPSSYLNLFMVYNAGYETADVPPAIKMACSNTIRDMKQVNDTNLNSMLQSESITNYSYSLGSGVIDWIHQELKRYYSDLDPFVKKVI
jgi:hypothetical protein